MLRFPRKAENPVSRLHRWAVWASLGKDVELSGWLHVHHVKVCKGLCRLALPLPWDSLGSLSMSTVTLSYVYLKPDIPPLHPASGGLALHLHVVCEVWHTFPAVHHSCAICCAVTPQQDRHKPHDPKQVQIITLIPSQNFQVGKGNEHSTTHTKMSDRVKEQRRPAGNQLRYAYHHPVLRYWN